MNSYYYLESRMEEKKIVRQFNFFGEWIEGSDEIKINNYSLGSKIYWRRKEVPSLRSLCQVTVVSIGMIMYQSTIKNWLEKGINSDLMEEIMELIGDAKLVHIDPCVSSFMTED